MFSEICSDYNSQLMEFEGEEDHVHLLLKIAPTIRISDLVRTLKSKTSKINELFQENFEGWDWGFEEPSDVTVFQEVLDHRVSAGFGLTAFCNEVHGCSPLIKAVVAIDLDSRFGYYSYTCSDNTAEEDIKSISKDFANSVIENVKESIAWAHE